MKYDHIQCSKCGAKLPLGTFSYGLKGVRFESTCKECNILMWWEIAYQTMNPNLIDTSRLLEAATFTTDDLKFLKDFHIEYPREEAA